MNVEFSIDYYSKNVSNEEHLHEKRYKSPRCGDVVLQKAKKLFANSMQLNRPYWASTREANRRIVGSFCMLVLGVFSPVALKGENVARTNEISSFRLEVSYFDFFPDCRENFEDFSCKWNFLLISRPPLNELGGCWLRRL